MSYARIYDFEIAFRHNCTEKIEGQLHHPDERPSFPRIPVVVKLFFYYYTSFEFFLVLCVVELFLPEVQGIIYFRMKFIYVYMM